MDDKKLAFPIYIQRGMMSSEDIRRIEEKTGRVVVELYAGPTNKVMDSVADSANNLRDWFAGMALQGMIGHMKIQISKENLFPFGGTGEYRNEVLQRLSECCYEVADSMLAEREKSGR